MKILRKTFLAAGAATAMLSAVPSTAQVQGNMATVNAPLAIINTNAFRTAYQQIGTTYATQIETIRQRGQEQQTLLQQLDTNSDGQLDEAEQQAAQNTTQAQRLGQIEQELAQLTGQLDAARIYVIEQVARQYQPALQQVAQQQNIQIVFGMESVRYAQPQANITQAVTTQLNGLVATAAITPPQDWQPQRNSIGLYQDIQQLLIIMQAQAAQQQQQQQTPQGR